jgi:O-antigen ligase
MYYRFDLLAQNIPGRSRIWQDSLSIVQDHLFLGTGLDSFLDLFRLYQTHLSESKWICHAHSDYLELTTELGVPVAGGLVIFGWGYWLRQAWQVFYRTRLEQGPELILAAGALAGAAAFFAHGLVEFNWQIPANQFYFVIMLVLAHWFLSRAK